MGIKPNTILRQMVVSWGWPADSVRRIGGRDDTIELQLDSAQHFGYVSIKDSIVVVTIATTLNFCPKETHCTFDITTEGGWNSAKQFFVDEAIKALSKRSESLTENVHYLNEVVARHNKTLKRMSRRSKS